LARGEAPGFGDGAEDAGTSGAGGWAASVYEQTGSHGRYSFLDGLRDGTTVPEAHAGIDDIFIVQEGEATLLYGGKVEGVPHVATGAIHGRQLVGAESVKLSPGDIPHLMLVEPGESITFLGTVPARTTRWPEDRHPDWHLYVALYRTELLRPVRRGPPWVRAASIGPVTSATARNLDLTVAVEAAEHTVEGLVEAILGTQNT